MILTNNNITRVFMNFSIYNSKSMEVENICVIPTPRTYLLNYSIERGANAVGMSILLPVTTEGRDRDRSS